MNFLAVITNHEIHQILHGPPWDIGNIYIQEEISHSISPRVISLLSHKYFLKSHSGPCDICSILIQKKMTHFSQHFEKYTSLRDGHNVIFLSFVGSAQNYLWGLNYQLSHRRMVITWVVDWVAKMNVFPKIFMTQRGWYFLLRHKYENHSSIF